MSEWHLHWYVILWGFQTQMILLLIKYESQITSVIFVNNLTLYIIISELEQITLNIILTFAKCFQNNSTDEEITPINSE